MKKANYRDVYSYFLNSIGCAHKVWAASVVLVTGLLCGCSDNDVLEKGEQQPETANYQAITVNNNPADQANRIVLYGEEGARSRAAEGIGGQKYKIKEVALIKPQKIEGNPLSATCIYPYNGKAYVCYHLNEAYGDNKDQAEKSKQQGCVEVIDYSNDAEPTILSELINAIQDFNHCIVSSDGGYMYTAGDTRNGAHLGVVKLDGGVFAATDQMKVKKLNGGSGNCIVEDGGSFRIATFGGFQSLSTTDLNETDEFIKTDGSAKHVAKGENKIATLHLENVRDAASGDQKEADAVVNVYDSWGGNPFTIRAGVITPTNGKNTIAIKDGAIYVCLGETGVAKYTLDGTLQGTYSWMKEHPTSDGRACANGVAVDDRFVYIAYGGAGLVVLDKETMKRVDRCVHRDKVVLEDGSTVTKAVYSANYVALVGDKIFVAYGRNGLGIMKINEVSGSEGDEDGDLQPEENPEAAISVNNDPKQEGRFYYGDSGATSRATGNFRLLAGVISPEAAGQHLSATCVYPYNGKAYVCYHLNEAYGDNKEQADKSKHQGCVELIDVNNGTGEGTIWSQLNNYNHDFNHCIVSSNGKYMYTAGDTEAGARLGVIELNENEFVEKETMEVYPLNGGSGNCVVEDGTNLHLATNTGFLSLPIDNLASTNNEFVETNGSAKHIATDGTTIVTLNLEKTETENGKEMAEGTVTVKGSSVYPKTFKVGYITPVDGKNTIAVKDNYIYVCCGENGVAKYNLNGEELRRYNWKKEHPQSDGKPCANGVAVGNDGLVYVAYGGAGLIVLDQAMNRIAQYQPKTVNNESGEASANYVALVGNQIYIAYGRRGLQVVTMEKVNQ